MSSAKSYGWPSASTAESSAFADRVVANLFNAEEARPRPPCKAKLAPPAAFVHDLIHAGAGKVVTVVGDTKKGSTLEQPIPRLSRLFSTCAR